MIFFFAYLSLLNFVATAINTTPSITAGRYVVQHPNKHCSLDTMLGSLDQCRSAKAELDPSADPVKSGSSKDAPKGCSRTNGMWFFNTHDTGALDGGGPKARRMLSDCNHCNEYKVSGVPNNWYNQQKWARKKDSMCGGKAVYRANDGRFLIYDHKQQRWEFSDRACNQNKNWYVGGAGVQCPGGNDKGWKATCTKTVATTTTTSGEFERLFIYIYIKYGT